MRFPLPTAALSLALALTAVVHPAAAQDWSRVQKLQPGSTVSVKTKAKTTTCHVQAVDADSITCTKIAQPFPRADIRRVTVHRRALSGIVGFAAFGGIGAAIGGGISNPNGIGGRGLGALVFGVPLAVIGAIVGVATDFAHSTLYEAP